MIQLCPRAEELWFRYPKPGELMTEYRANVNDIVRDQKIREADTRGIFTTYEEKQESTENENSWKFIGKCMAFYLM